jgi:hypothetical protein
VVAPPRFDVRALEDLEITDEASFRHVGLYGELKDVLRRDAYSFRVLPEASRRRWDRALCLNLCFWGTDQGGDILDSPAIPADVVAHVAWHHLASKALAPRAFAKPTASALFFGEAIASAFDVYLVGRLLGHAPDSAFLETQVSAMADACAEAGLDDAALEALLEGIADDPEASFEALRALLFDVSRDLLACESAEAALAVFEKHETRPLAPLLHRFELASWVLYARAYAEREDHDPRPLELDASLRGAGGGLDGLVRRWLPGA